MRNLRLIALLVALLALLFAFPYVQGALLGDVVLNALQAGIVIAVVAVVSTDRKSTALAVALGAMSLLSGWVPRSAEHLWYSWLAAGAASASIAWPCF